MKRLSVSLNDSSFQELKEYCESTGASLSSVTAIAIKNYIDQQTMLKSLPDLMTLAKSEMAKIEQKNNSGENS